MAEPFVYDKAKYHAGGNFPEELPAQQALVHTGMYLGWIIDHELCSGEFARASAEQIAAFKARKMTGPQIYEHWDGTFIDEMLSEEGNAFTRTYFNFDGGQFLGDYEELLAEELPTLYHVQDSWQNYDRLRARIDERYAAWRGSARKPWWQFWKS